jgi:hypothetical protein
MRRNLIILPSQAYGAKCAWIVTNRREDSGPSSALAKGTSFSLSRIFPFKISIEIKSLKGWAIAGHELVHAITSPVLPGQHVVCLVGLDGLGIGILLRLTDMNDAESIYCLSHFFPSSGAGHSRSVTLQIYYTMTHAHKSSNCLQ